MMKRKFVIFVLGLLLFVVGYTQEKDERDVGAFDRIKVSQGIVVELRKGNDEKVSITARGIDIDRVVTEVRGGILRIYLDGNRFRNVDVKVSVTFTEIIGVSVNSAAEVYSQSVIKADNFNIDVSSAGSTELELEANSVEIEVSSAGSVDLAGKVIELDVRVSSAGSIRAYDLEAEEVYIRASSAGSVRITVTRKIDARASSGGSVRYRGNPDKEYTSSSSGGSVRRSH